MSGCDRPRAFTDVIASDCPSCGHSSVAHVHTFREGRSPCGICEGLDELREAIKALRRADDALAEQVRTLRMRGLP